MRCAGLQLAAAAGADARSADVPGWTQGDDGGTGPARREEISKLQQKYVWGTFPPKPKISRVNVLDEKHSDGYLVRNVSLVFGPGDKGTMRVRVYIPDGKGPFPVMISTSLQGWASSLIRRGYIAAGDRKSTRLNSRHLGISHA